MAHLPGAALPQPRWVPGGRLLLMAAVGAWLSSAPCRAQSFAFTLDVAQGLQFGMDKPRTPYLFGAQLAPALELERARLSLVFGPSYRNPDWDFPFGGQLSLFVPFAVKDLGLRLAAQGEYLPLNKSARASFGIVAEAFGLIRIGLWPAYDFQLKRAELTLSIGVDLVSWNRLIAAGGDGGYHPR